MVNALEKTAYFTVGTDHKPLISIVNETGLGEIKTPRQQRLQERLKATHIPGKLPRGIDALSRNVVRKPSEETAYRIFSCSLATASEENSIATLVSQGLGHGN